MTFKQIVAAGAGEGYFVQLFGLTEDGKVYRYDRDTDKWEEVGTGKLDTRRVR